MMEIKAIISKEEIAVLGALKGRANEHSFLVDGGAFAPGWIAFHGFAGTLDLQDNRYHGVVQLEPCAQQVFCNLGDFAPVARAMETTESEVDDVLHGDDNREDHDRDDD